MCDPVTIGLLVAGTAASAVGTGIKSAEAQKNAARVAEARNARLKETLLKNRQHADDSRAAFNTRIGASEKGPADQQLADAQAGQTAAIQSNISPTATEAPLAGDAPTVIKTAFAKAFSDAAEKSMARAAATGKLGAYGTVQRDDAIGDRGLGDKIGTNNSFVRGNLGILPYVQDLAEIQATKPSNGLGDIISAFGQAASMYAGSRGGGVKAAPKINARVPTMYGGGHPVFG